MAGLLIAMLRVLQLKGPLQATVTSPEFKDLGMFVDLANVILSESVWIWLFLQCRGVYDMMRILRLADQKSAAMDKLHFYIKQADRIAPLYLAQAEKHRDALSVGLMSTIKSTNDLASVDLEDKQDEDDGYDSNGKVPALDDGEESDDEDDDDDFAKVGEEVICNSCVPNI